jgi:16S rRNA (guanine527-N7)-methyltransferase
VSTPARELFGEGFELVAQYVDVLADRGVTWGLIGPREVDRLWDRHILNSVAISDLIPSGSSVADIGSGAGLPGIPLAILRPDLQLTLVEPLLRRCTFLTQAVDELGITDRVTVVRSRAEDLHATFDVVVARAVAPLERLVRWCAPLRGEAGVILALKGASAAEEVRKAAPVLAARRLSATVLSVRAHPSAVPTAVVRLGALNS